MAEQTVNGQNELKINVVNPEEGGNATRSSIAKASQTEKDGNFISAGMQIMKTLDANRYATKKTIAQGMLDIALLTANASQLKYILQVGHKHEFYTLMLSLIIVSIVLQVCNMRKRVAKNSCGFISPVYDMSFTGWRLMALNGILCVFLGSSLNINKNKEQDKANKVNNVCLAMNIVIVTLNVIISSFDIREGLNISDLIANLTNNAKEK